jgi:ribosomal protein S18 acetylase RimI-like enzyme
MTPSTTTTPAELVTAGPDDAASLLPLVRDYHHFEHIHMSDEQRQRAIAPLLEADATTGRIWLIRSAGQLVGYVAICFGYSIEFRGRDAFIDELFIIESARGHGLGTAVLEQVKSLAAALGVVALHLEVARDNAAARRLYRRAGFASRERFHLMSCTLPDGLA